MDKIFEIVNALITDLKRKLNMPVKVLRKAEVYRAAGIVRQYECELYVANLIGKVLVERGVGYKMIPAGTDETFYQSLMFDEERAAIWFSHPLYTSPNDWTTGLITMPHKNDKIKEYSQLLAK